MRRLLNVFIALLMLITFVGCTSSGNEEKLLAQVVNPNLTSVEKLNEITDEKTLAEKLKNEVKQWRIIKRRRLCRLSSFFPSRFRYQSDQK